MSLPTMNVQNLAAAVSNSNFVPENNSGDTIYCRFDYETGDYLLGKEADNIAGENVLIHTDSICVGWVCWSSGGGKPAKQLVPFIQGLPPQPEPLNGNNWVEARGIMFKTEDGIQATLEGNSYGIRSGVDDLIMKIRERAMNPANAEYLYPRVNLSSNNYRHSQGGIIHNMVLNVVEWCNVNGDSQPDKPKLEAVKDEPTNDTNSDNDKPAPRRRRRSSPEA